MPKGERDYTSRSVATIAASGILGGRIIFREDFESLPIRSTVPGDTFAIETGTGTVWEGDASGSHILTNGVLDIYELHFPAPTPDIISAEVIFRPSNYNLEDTYFRFYINDGSTYHYTGFRVRYTGTSTVLEILNEAAAWEIVKTIVDNVIQNKWHILYFRVDLGSEKYEFGQFDTTRVPLTSYQYPRETGTYPPLGTAELGNKALAGLDTTVYFDNLTLAYEET